MSTTIWQDDHGSQHTTPNITVSVDDGSVWIELINGEHTDIRLGAPKALWLSGAIKACADDLADQLDLRAVPE